MGAAKRRRCSPNYDVVWFEEALPPDDLEGFIELRRHSPLPIATGEVLTRRQSFRPFLERHAVDIIQPDCTKCGGLTEAWRIAWMAYEHNVLWVPHGWNTAIGLAADLHLAAAMPVARYVEYLTPSPYIDELITEPFKPDAEGFLHDSRQAGPGHRAEPRGAEAVWGVIVNRPPASGSAAWPEPLSRGHPDVLPGLPDREQQRTERLRLARGAQPVPLGEGSEKPVDVDGAQVTRMTQVVKSHVPSRPGRRSAPPSGGCNAGPGWRGVTRQ